MPYLIVRLDNWDKKAGKFLVPVRHRNQGTGRTWDIENLELGEADPRMFRCNSKKY